LPLLREADLIGILLVSRDIVQPFDDQHLELLTTFADQTVIAIETPGCSRRSNSALVNSASRWSNRRRPRRSRWDGEALHLLAAHNTPPAFAEARKRSPRHPSQTGHSSATTTGWSSMSRLGAPRMP
jgi:hypothetical protein